MNDDPRSHGLWEASAPPAPTTGPLTERLAVDVAVIGAGFTGLSAALHLAQGGASVAVLEAREIGFGGSGRNVGLVNAGMWVMPSALPGQLGEVHGSRLLQLLGGGPRVVFDLVERHGIDCEAVQQGTLHCAVGAAGLRDIAERARQWQAHGAPVHLLGAAETARRIGTTAYRGSLLDLRAGTIQPLAYARGLARAAMAEGAKLYSRTPVTSIVDQGSRWRLATGSGGSLDAPWVIFATNAYSSKEGIGRGLDCELVRLPYFNLATPPLAPALLDTILPERQGAWDTRQILSSMRLDRAGRLVFGSVGALRGTGRAIHRDWGRRAMTQLFPQLRGIDFEHEWYGWIGMTPNALPRFHRLARNTVSFSGYNGRGIAPGTVFGRELARLVLGQIREEDLPLPITGIEPTSLRGARQAFYEFGSQAAHVVDARGLRD